MEIKHRQFRFINSDGAGDEPGEEPHPEQVRVRKRFLRNEVFMTTFFSDRTSYGFKHEVERWAEEYISNGAFIMAAMQEGFWMERERETLNVHFNIGLKAPT